MTGCPDTWLARVNWNLQYWLNCFFRIKNNKEKKLKQIENGESQMFIFIEKYILSAINLLNVL